MVDFDVGLRNLDLVMGAERRVVFDLINVVQGVAKLAGADPRQAHRDLVAAAGLADPRQGRADRGRRRQRYCELRGKFDWVICDSLAGIERGATLAMRFADAVIVTNLEVSWCAIPTASSGCSIPRPSGPRRASRSRSTF